MSCSLGGDSLSLSCLVDGNFASFLSLSDPENLLLLSGWLFSSMLLLSLCFL